MSEPKAGGHFRLMFPTDFLAAPEFLGKDVALTIKHVSIDDLPLAGTSDKQKRPVVAFEETPKRWVLNKTCARTLAKLLGTQTADWVGKRIALYPTTCKFGPDTVDCIRVRPQLPKPAAPRDVKDPAPAGDGAQP